MNCPACRSALAVVEREGIEVDWCLDCRGLWFDQGELQLLGEKAGRVLDVADLSPEGPQPPGPSRRRCPRCPRRMEQLRLATSSGEPIEVDRCVEHGFWLDRGELGRLMAASRPAASQDGSLVLEFLGETFAEGVEQSAPSARR